MSEDRDDIGGLDAAGSGREIDVCLLLEGTYPYVRGGVSAWVHQMVSSLPELTFGILFIGADRATAGAPKYELPANVACLRHVFLFEVEDGPPEAPTGKNLGAKPGDHRIRTLCDGFRQACEAGEIPSKERAEQLGRLLDEVYRVALELEFAEFWRSQDVWETMQWFYRRGYADESFVDFFWNARFLIEPLWRALRAGNLLPPAKVYHSVSTGYAGILGAVAARNQGRPFLLSEHGIYVRERIADLLRSEWSPSLRPHSRMTVDGVGVLRHLWIELFIQLGRITYDSSERIISLFQKNADYQVEFGAEASRIQIIPNGVKLDRFDSVIAERQRRRAALPNRKQVGFLGRVVSIKDVRTLIRAARITCREVPDAQFLIVGPTEEDEEYAEGCRKLIRELDLQERVLLTGAQPMEAALPEFDVMVLSSISEGLPFSVLEGFAAGIPVVSTDVGFCAELILGGRGEKPHLGPAGAIVEVGDAAALGDALTKLLRNRDLQDRQGQAGRARTEAFYEEQGVVEAYRTLYQELAGEGSKAACRKGGE